MEQTALALVTGTYRGTPNDSRLMTELSRAAEYRGVTTCQDLAVIMGFPIQG